MGVIGLGYEGRDLAGFLAEVTGAGVQVVTDVRLNPVSRKRGFSRHALAETLASVGVAYRHEPALGNPKENRAGFAGSLVELVAARRRYAQRLTEPAAQQALMRVAEIARTSRIAVLCFEADQARCHRTLVLYRLVDLIAGGAK